MNHDLQIWFNSQEDESVVATLRVKDDVAEYKQARKLAIKNLGNNPLELTVQYLNTAGAWTDTAIATQTVVAQAERTFELYAQEGDYVRFQIAGETYGWLTVYEVVNTSNVSHFPASPISGNNPA